MPQSIKTKYIYILIFNIFYSIFVQECSFRLHLIFKEQCRVSLSLAWDFLWYTVGLLYVDCRASLRIFGLLYVECRVSLYLLSGFLRFSVGLLYLVSGFSTSSVGLLYVKCRASYKNSV
jgi:hypothetical protein